jgi:hypothetical protein
LAEINKIKSNHNAFLAEVINAIEEKLEEVSRRTVMIDAVVEHVSKRVKTELPVLFQKQKV